MAVSWPPEYFTSRTPFDDLTLVHDEHIGTKAGDHCEIVGHEEQSKPQVFGERLEQLQNLVAHESVECAYRFVGNQQSRLGRECARDRNALTLSS